MTGTDLIAGRYRLGGLLGSGGSASVFVADDLESGTTVALKLLHPHLAADRSARDGLFREALAAGTVRHPNLVSVLDAGLQESAAGPVVWIALDLAPGISLAEFVELNGALDIDQALAVATGVARALEAAHAAGLVHRDISPANIMVDPAPDTRLVPEAVRVVDFGLADVAGRPVAVAGADAPPTVVGNAKYMSPEQAVGDDIDERADLYQLGAVLYFMLTGRPPFAGESAAATMQAHVSSPPPVPSVARSEVPRTVDRLVVKAMLKRPDDRYQTAAELLAAVAAAGSAAAAASDTRTLLFPRTDATARIAAPVGKPEPPRLAVDRVADAPAPADTHTATGTPVDTPWAWRLGIAVLVVGALVAWIVSSATTAAPPEAEAAPTVAEQPTPTAPAPPAVAPPARIAVPDTVGATLADASAALAAAGLVVGTVSEAASPLSAGSVSASVPGAGADVGVGGIVDLVVASGRNLVPTVRGMPRDAAIAAIQGAGFGILLTETTDTSVDRGTVLATSPSGGAEVAVGRPVTVTVATGPAPTPSATPSPTATPTAAPPPGG